MEYVAELVYAEGPIEPPAGGSGWRIISTASADDGALWVIWERKKRERPVRRTKGRA